MFHQFIFNKYQLLFTNNNYITVVDVFDAWGSNALKITIANFNFAGNMKIKVYG